MKIITRIVLAYRHVLQAKILLIQSHILWQKHGFFYKDTKPFAIYEDEKIIGFVLMYVGEENYQIINFFFVHFFRLHNQKTVFPLLIGVPALLSRDKKKRKSRILWIRLFLLKIERGRKREYHS